MSRSTFSDANVAGLIQHLIPIEVDVDLPAAASAVNRYKVAGTPTVLIIGPEERELLRRDGYIEAHPFYNLLSSALSDSAITGELKSSARIPSLMGKTISQVEAALGQGSGFSGGSEYFSRSPYDAMITFIQGSDGKWRVSEQWHRKYVTGTPRAIRDVLPNEVLKGSVWIWPDRDVQNITAASRPDFKVRAVMSDGSTWDVTVNEPRGVKFLVGKTDDFGRKAIGWQVSREWQDTTVDSVHVTKVARSGKSILPDLNTGPTEHPLAILWRPGDKTRIKWAGRSR